MWVTLVAHIPDDLIARRIEHRVQRHGQLDHAKPRAQMPARHRDRRNRLRAQLIGDALQLAIRQRFEVRRRGHTVNVGVLGRSLIAASRRSGFARDNEPRRLSQGIGIRAVRPQGGAGFLNQRLRAEHGLAQPQKRDEGGLARLSVFAEPFSGQIRIALNIKMSSAIWKARPRACA